jgi:hypothetical protein
VLSILLNEGAEIVGPGFNVVCHEFVSVRGEVGANRIT